MSVCRDVEEEFSYGWDLEDCYIIWSELKDSQYARLSSISQYTSDRGICCAEFFGDSLSLEFTPCK